MRNFTKSLLALALMFVCVVGAKAKTELALPGAWADGMKDGSTYTFNGSWQGAATGVWGDWSGTEYEYVWVKYTGFTGNLRLKVEYDEFLSTEWYGDSYVQQEVSFADASGILFLAIDKTTLFVNGSKDGEHKGEIYAKHIRQVILQDAGAASTLTIEGLYVGTYAEMLSDMGYDVSKNHVLKVTNSAAKENIWDNSVTYSLASPLTSGKTYTVSAKICAVDVTKGTMMKFVLAEGNKAKYGDERAILANTFCTVSQTFEADGNTGIEIEFGFANGVVYIDDVTCIEEGSSINLISNSDFEEPLSTAGWTVPGWTGQSLSQAEQELGEVALGAQKVTIGSTGWATMFAYDPLSVPADVNVYFAKYDSEKGNVKLTAETTLPQWGRAVINGDPGDYYFPKIDAANVTADWADSGLEVSWNNVTADGSTIYALGKKNDVVGFYLVKSGVVIPSGKAYLPVTGGGAREFIGFGDDATGINAVEQAAKVDNQYFNLAGQRVAQPTKGLYIVNGKKVIIK